MIRKCRSVVAWQNKAKGEKNAGNTLAFAYYFVKLWCCDISESPIYY